MKKGLKSLNRLVEELQRLPGIGKKSAERLTFFLLKSDSDLCKNLAQSIGQLQERVRFCSDCGGITETNPCGICSDDQREKELICVVEEPRDVFAIERTGEFKGVYQVLMGAISPLDGVGPEDLRIGPLLDKVKNGGVQEVILATNPNMEGETTASYLSTLLRPYNVRVTRIARGLPMGGDLEYADEVTLTKSLQGRQEI